jgi:predicted amidohydrolase
MKVAAVQHDIEWEDPPANHAHLAPLIGEAAAAGARLVVLSEMFATGFSMAAARIAEAEDGPTTRFLVTQATEHGVWVCGSLPEHTPGFDRPTNRFVLAGPDGTVHRYSKVHPFSYADEHEHYAAGTERITVDVEGVRVTPFVCYDLRFGDSFWAEAETTDCYVVVANWPAARRHHWRTLLTARAIENQAYVVGVNRVGTGDGIDYAGDSCIIDPLGQPRAEAPSVETTLFAEVDPDVVRDVRSRFPFLVDRTSAAEISSRSRK